MPNWVKNKVYIENKNAIKENYVDNGEEELFDFNKIIPRPRSLDLPSGSFEESSIRYALYKMGEDKKKELLERFKDNVGLTELFNVRYLPINEHYSIERLNKDYEDFNEILNDKDNWRHYDIYEELNIKDLEDLGNAYINNLINYNYSSWYDWSVSNWGTKWNACSTYYIDDNNIEFETAWSTPEEIFKEISRKYNTLVRVEYADEDIGYNCGIIVYDNGKLIVDILKDRQFALDLWGWEDYEEED